MFGNIYRKYLLRAIRSRDMIIWTLLFPIMLATLFYFAFSSLEEADAFHSVPTAVVQDRAFAKEIYLKQMLEMLGEGETPALEIQWVKDSGEADALLKDDQVKGYIAVENGAPKLYVKEDGIYQTILKNILDRYLQIRDTVMTMIAEDPEAALSLAMDFSGLFQDGGETAEGASLFSGELIEDIALSRNTPSETLPYYYALLAMLCLYGGFHGLVVIEGLQANLSPQGARNTISPCNRYNLFCASCLGALTIQFFCGAVSLLYMKLVLKVSFGSQLGYAFLAMLVGSMAGIAFGSLVALPSKWKGGTKTGVLIGVSMICCFFAGLMIGGINYIVEKKFPLLAKINPAALIADAFYCLYYYDDHVQYFQDLGILLLMTAAFLGICIAFARREQYESI